MSADPYAHTTYMLRRKVFRLFGGAFHIDDPYGQVVLYSEQKAFRLREDFRLYSDETRSQELLSIRTPQILDFGATYDVVDSRTGQTVGALRRHGMRSLVRDEWALFDADRNQAGVIREDNLALALLRRWVGLLPQTFHAEWDGHAVATYRQHFNPFVQKIDIDFSSDPDGVFDRRLGLAAAVLLCAIEGRQE